MRHSKFRFIWIAASAALTLTLVACGAGEEANTAAPAGDDAGAADTAPAAGDAEAGEIGEGYDAIADLQEGDATITGTVRYAGTPPNLPAIDMAADPSCAEMHDEAVQAQALVLGGDGTMGNVFVQVADGMAAGEYTAPTTPVVIDQEGCMYHPHVVGMMAGQGLQFLNSDGILHNVHGTPKNNREFNLGMPGSVTHQTVSLNTPEEYAPVKCDVHPWMSAFVGVMDHPYWEVTEDDGAFSMTVPAGTYTIEAWHERLGTQTQEVTVAAGESASVDFEFAAPQQ
jgi:plastocyanin